MSPLLQKLVFPKHGPLDRAKLFRSTRKTGQLTGNARAYVKPERSDKNSESRVHQLKQKTVALVPFDSVVVEAAFYTVNTFSYIPLIHLKRHMSDFCLHCKVAKFINKTR